MNHLIVSITFLFALSDALAVEFDNTVLLHEDLLQESYGPSAQGSEDEFAFYYNATFRDVLEVNVNNQIGIAFQHITAFADHLWIRAWLQC